MNAQEHQIDIGPKVVGDTELGFVYAQPTGTVYTPLLCLIQNLGDVDFVFDLESSDDNEVTDAWVAKNVRVNWIAVATVSVPARQQRIFQIEIAKVVLDDTMREHGLNGDGMPWYQYHRFKTDTPATAYGRLTVIHLGGGMNWYHREDETLQPILVG